jgi:argininosuccinate lyase
MNETKQSHHRPIWDRGEAVDSEMLAFTIGDDWLMDKELVAFDIQGSIAHAGGLRESNLLSVDDHDVIVAGLGQLLQAWHAGEWSMEAADEDVHSAVERRLTDLVGEVGGRLHLGRSRNDQVATDIRLWIRSAGRQLEQQLDSLRSAMQSLVKKDGTLPLPGYTHLRRAMPSSVGDWMKAHDAGIQRSQGELEAASVRWATCPLGSGSGYGVPLALQRSWVAEKLGFEGPEQPVTLSQLSRGRAELAFVTVLESVALDLGKLASDLWLYSSSEFGFLHLPTEFTTGSSLMPQKRNPDVLELVRAQCRQVAQDRDALRAVLIDLPSGYHRDFQLLKPPLFRAFRRMKTMLPLLSRLLPALKFEIESLNEAAADPALAATAAALAKATKDGSTFRAAYREGAKQNY